MVFFEDMCASITERMEVLESLVLAGASRVVLLYV